MSAVEPTPAEPYFALPADRVASVPPERRGVPRDGVRLLVAGRSGVQHRRFRDLPQLLTPGDLLVVNTSATLPAALDGEYDDGSRALVHVCQPFDRHSWTVEIRRGDNSGPQRHVGVGTRIRLASDVCIVLAAGYPDDARDRGSRLWSATVLPPSEPIAFLQRNGRPIRYPYVQREFPLADYQTVYADEPGSAEMASAGRPVTAQVLLGLVRRGIPVAPVVLHAGVSSQEAHEPPLPEPFRVPEATAHLVNVTRAAGHRVVAVGTTTTRALEAATGPDGVTRSARGWADVVLGPHRPARAVTGLLTGLHAPQASHLLLLEAVAGQALVRRAYTEAVARDYLWHEFGDVSLFLPPGPA